MSQASHPLHTWPVRGRDAYEHRLAREHSIRWAVRVGGHTGLVVVGSLGDGGPHDQWTLGDTPTLTTQMQEEDTPAAIL